MSDTRRSPAVFCLLASVPPEFGGLTRSAFERSSMMVENGLPVTLLVRSYRPETHATLDKARERGILDPRVEVLCHWEVAAPSGDGGAVVRPGIVEELVGAAALAGGSAESTHDDCGRLATVRHLDERDRLVAVESHDTRGRLCTVTVYDPVTGVPEVMHYLDRDGTPWVHFTVDPGNGLPLRGELMVDGELRKTLSRGGVQALWLNPFLAQFEDPVLFVDSRTGDHVVLPVRVPQLRLIAVGHNNHFRVPASAESPFRASWGRLIANADHFDALVLLSDEQRADFVPIVARSTQLRVIPHPAHPPRPPRQPVTRSDRTVVCLARFVGQKRLDHAIEAFALVVKQVPDARLDLYGSGPNEAKLRGLIAKRGLGGSVFLRGHTSDPDTPLRGAACMLMSSAYEGLPLVLFEALALGTPVVSYDLKYGPRMVVRDGVDGLLAPDGDIDALAAALVRVLTDGELRASMGNRAPEVLDRFPRSTWQERWLALVQDVVDAPRRDRTTAPRTVPGVPGISVLVPVAGYAPHLRAAVRSVLRQSYPGAREVLLALGPCSEGTEKVARDLARDRRVKLVANPTGSVPAALNAAWAASRHPVIVRADADAELPPDYVLRAVEILERTGAAAVGGGSDARGGTAFERAAACAATSAFSSGARMVQQAEAGPAETVHLGVFRSDVFEDLEGYDELFLGAQDRELDARIREAGGVVWSDPDLVAVRHAAPGLKALARASRDDGRWRHALARAHPTTTTGPDRWAPATVVALVLGTTAALVGLVTWTPWLLLGLAVPLGYAVAVGLTVARSPSSLGRRSRAWLLAILPTTQLAWGWGYLTARRVTRRGGPHGLSS